MKACNLKSSIEDTGSSVRAKRASMERTGGGPKPENRAQWNELEGAKETEKYGALWNYSAILTVAVMHKSAWRVGRESTDSGTSG